MTELRKVIVYADGACLNNPGPGGYGVVLLCDGRRKELAGGFRLTTSNRMELTAAITGLRALKCSCEVSLRSDSRYVVDGMTKGWARRWREHGWQRTAHEKARNHDLWGELLDACAGHAVVFEWVRGHAGDPENERCDQLAVAASLGEDLPPDEGYEQEQAAGPWLPLFDWSRDASGT
jgi:ribonuclease HI